MNRLSSKGAARLASALVLLFIIGSGTAFAYSTRAPGTGVQSRPFGHGPSGPHPSDGDQSQEQSHTTTTCSSKATSQTSRSQTSAQPSSTARCSDENQEEGAETSTSLSSTGSGSSKQTPSGNNQQGANETSRANDETDNENQAGANGTTGFNQEGEHQSYDLGFKIVPTTASEKGQGEVNIGAEGLVLTVQAQIENATSSTQYTLVLTVNGTSNTLGSLMTDKEGDAGIHAQFNATKPGTYAVGVTLLRESTPSLKTDPSTQTFVLTQTTKGSTQGQNQNQQGEDVNEVKENQQQEQQIEQAKASNTIPAVVQVTGQSATASVLDSRFSVSVGKLGGGGLAVQISANNATGPRVLLVDLSSSANLTSRSLLVTLDGKKITQASSATQVLAPKPTDPALYIVIGTSTGYQLLVSVPHFSVHLIQILPGLARTAGSLLSIDGSVLALSIVAVTALLATAYVRRAKVRL